MIKFVHDIVELKKFFDLVLPPLSNEEVYFTSLSARNKQLTEEERRFYDLGRTEMFERKIIRERDFLKFARTIYKYEMSEAGITGRSGVPLPAKCLIIYMNINPCNMVQAYRVFQNEMTENVYNLISGKGSSPDFFKRMDRLLMNAIQKSKGEKHFIDIDIDMADKGLAKQYQFIDDFLNALKANGVEYFLIDTKGGWHVLMKKESIHYNFNTTIFEFQKKANETPELGIKEMGISTNGMIPLPGTLQAEYPVKVWWEMSNFHPNLDKVISDELCRTHQTLIFKGEENA